MYFKTRLLVSIFIVMALLPLYSQKQWDENSFRKNQWFFGKKGDSFSIFRITADSKTPFKELNAFLTGKISGKDYFILYDQGRKALISSQENGDTYVNDIFYIDSVKKKIRNITNDKKADFKMLQDYAVKGGAILYKSFPEGQWDNAVLRTVGLNGKNAKTLESPEIEGIGSACWLDDRGTRAFLVYRQGKQHNFGIWNLKKNSFEPKDKLTDVDYWISDVDITRNKIILDTYGGDNTDYIYYVKENSLKKIPTGGADSARGFRWSPDGAKIAFISYGNDSQGVYILSEKTGKCSRIIEDGAGSIRWITNTKLAYDAGQDGIHILNTATSSSVPITKDFEYSFFEGKACPRLFIAERGAGYKYLGETLENRRFVMSPEPEMILLHDCVFKDGTMKVKIREIHDEVTYIESVQLEYEGEIFVPYFIPEKYRKDARGLLKLNKGDSVELLFKGLEGETADATLILKGYYNPLH
ncbi:MAG: PD40 domain-containing protein [Spirochaetales bacterium]|nr:PD40 domain-containing protein [Spirochaetales bacterium]